MRYHRNHFALGRNGRGSTGLPFWRISKYRTGRLLRALPILAHVCDHLAHGDFLAVVHQQLAIVGVRGQHTVGVLDDDQIAVAAQTAAGVDHPAGTRGAHVLSQASRQAECRRPAPDEARRHDRWATPISMTHWRCPALPAPRPPGRRVPGPSPVTPEAAAACSPAGSRAHAIPPRRPGAPAGAQGVALRARPAILFRGRVPRPALPRFGNPHRYCSIAPDRDNRGRGARQCCTACRWGAPHNFPGRSTPVSAHAHSNRQHNPKVQIERVARNFTAAIPRARVRNSRGRATGDRSASHPWCNDKALGGRPGPPARSVARRR